MHPTIRLAAAAALFLALTAPVLAAAPARELAPEHALLNRFEGSWTELLTFKASPEAETVLLNETAHSRVILGGRYLETRSRGFSGASCHEGLALMGFEPEKERFSAVWFENGSTTSSVMYGKLDVATQTLVFESEVDKSDGSHHVWTYTLPRDGKYRWSFKLVHADGTTGREMTAVGSRIDKK